MTAIQASAVVVFYPLRFGDAGQIAAVQLLADIDGLKAVALRDKWTLCSGCGGKTYITATDCGCGDRECGLCSADWMEACGLCSEVGLLDSEMEPPIAASEAGLDARTAVIEWMRALAAESCTVCWRTHVAAEWPCFCACHREGQ